ncbi:MAG TPA: DUF6531 domain-containing protein [Candidatus Rubrimentiphilum sp.]|nr:DUF6531 domain-containing protein [Candidatus Rubrimentiphilum sp.]
MDVTMGAANPTGTNSWWTYRGGGLPGVGEYMVNVANGNLVVETTDVDVHERGVNLTFQRNYNSLSLRNWNANGQSDDGAPTPSTYGSGWTNTFDTHLAGNSSGGISVFDADGARYDYTPNGTGCLTAPAGVHTTLCFDGGCGYLWGKKDGTVYYYWTPWLATNCLGGRPDLAAYSGRLYMIFGRNNNNWIRLTYSWAGGDSSTTSNLTQIVAQHENGQALTLSFGSLNGKILLSSITRPDNQQIIYQYAPNPGGSNAYSNLEEVDLPGNNAGTIHQQYGYYSDTGLMYWANSPRWFGSGAGEGSFTIFYYDGSARISAVDLYGWGNFTPADGTGAVLQSNYPNQYGTIRYLTLSYSSGETQFTDLDGHATNWFFDTLGRVTQTQSWTGSLWLISSATWNSDNAPTEMVDQRGNASDYAYDSNGNIIAAALPAVSTSQGTFRPTSLYSYDRTNNANNIVAYCDATRTHALGQDWAGSPGSSDSLCPNQAGATRYSWDYSDGAEPFGRITSSFTPLGYHRSFSYDSGAQGGDFGLPTAQTGDCVSQNDGTNRCPSQTYSYDGLGNLTSHNKGNGTWTSTFDAMNQPVSTTDPDGVTIRTCYYSNGQISARQSALQYQMDGGTVCGSHSVAFTYDFNGNEKTETHHFGNVAATTTKWYDGVDRLVEVKQPQDPQDVYQNAWITRYLYDLSQGGTVSFTNGTTQYYAAHGSLFKTQELLAATSTWYWGLAQLNNNAFQDIKGTARDALDRVVSRYGPNETFTYDSSPGTYGALAQHCNALNVCGNVSYDNAGQTIQVSFTDGSTPSATAMYDPNGRAVSLTSSVFGAQSYSFDADGRETQSVEPSGGGVTSPATITYHYYADGRRSSLDVSSSGLSQANLLSYSYRADGKLQQQQINLSSNAIVGNSAINMTYSNGGRIVQRSESGPAANPTPTTVSYDINNGSNTGTVTALNYPAVNVSGFSYDAEGDLLSYQDSIVNVGASTRSFAYTDRHEEQMDSRSNVPAGTNANANFANGVMVAGTYNQNELSWNATGGTATGWDNPSNSETGNSTAFGYDTAGRQTSRDDTIYRFGNPFSYVSTRQYDAENRIISGSQQTRGLGLAGTYNTLTADQWGPNGHPILIGSTPRVSNATPSTSQLAYDTLHWDGGRLLFTTNSQGQVDDIKLAAGGDVTPLDAGYSGLTFWDRLAGSVAFCHNATGAAGNDASSTTHTANGCTLVGGQSMQQPTSIAWSSAGLAGGVGQGHILGMPGTDGLSDGTGILQGVRLYDPQLGGWTTPDAFQGRLDSPITQKSYVWNNDNSLAFSDPSGNDPAGETFWGTVGGTVGFILGAVAVVAVCVLIVAAAPEVLAAVAVVAGEAALESTAIEVTAADVVEGLDTVAGFDVPLFRIPFVRIPAIAQPLAKMAGAVGAAIGSHIGEDYAKSKDTAPSHNSFVFTYIWGDFETMDHQVLQYFYVTRVHNAENYGFHHGVLHDPFEGLNGAYDTMQSALNGGPGMMNYCWSCDHSSFAPAGNPFPR